MTDSASISTASTVAEVETKEGGVVKRWLAELDLASSTEKTWRTNSEKVWAIYQSKEVLANSFNIQWSNTETMRPALYNSTPKPDVRRRFRDRDPTGKVAATVLERSLAYSIDSYDFDDVIKAAVLDVLIPGRGLARVKYEPKFKSIEGAPAPAEGEEPAVEVDGEYAECEHVPWDKFRRGPGKKWTEVPWISFEHQMPHEQLVEMFGEEKAKLVKLDECGPTDKVYDESIKSLLKTGTVFEIWDKANRKVLFIAQGVADPLLEAEDPLRLKQFFCIPRPIYVIEDSTTLIPAILYEKYKPQAEELNKVTSRINRLVAALKVRGLYASHLGEIAQVIKSGDNEMSPISNASEIAALGGLDKAIWIMPIDKLSVVLEGLYVAREKTIQAIYEITGLGDIMRGVSNPHETLGAQQLKSQWGSLRLQRLQREVQRFIRDLLRLKAEIMSEHFSPESLAAMTGVKLPTAQEKAMLQQQLAAAQAPPPPPQPGMPPAPPPQQIPPEQMAQAQKILALPTWEDVMKLLKGDTMRQYRIDIETDSTVAETLTRDAQGMQEAITAIVNLGTGLAPAIQMGLMDVETFKSLASAVARTARMGTAVEDAIDQIKQPPPQAAPQEPPDMAMPIAQLEAESAEKIAGLEAQSAEKIASQKLESDAAVKQAQDAAKAQITGMQEETKKNIASIQEQNKRDIAALQEDTKKQIAAVQEQNKSTLAAAQESAKTERETTLAHVKSASDGTKQQVDGAVKVLIAHINALTQKDTAQIGADSKKETANIGADSKRETASIGADSKKEVAGMKPPKSDEAGDLKELLSRLADALDSPRDISFTMGADGKVAGARSSPVKKSPTTGAKK